jgi:1-deoxy-D-xylulose-5-phosphate synthase
MTLMAPKDLQELEAMLAFALRHDGPIGLRYPRGGVLRFHPEFTMDLPKDTAPIELGKAELLIQGSDLAVVALGSMVYPALEAAKLLEGEGISATVVNARFAKPLDMALFASLVKEHRALLVVEEGVAKGGFGASLLSEIEEHRSNGFAAKVMGIPDAFFEHGKREILLEQAGLTPQAIAAAAKELLSRSPVYAR